MGGLLGNYVIVIKIERSKVYKKDKDFILRGLCREEVLLHFGSKKGCSVIDVHPLCRLPVHFKNSCISLKLF